MDEDRVCLFTALNRASKPVDSYFVENCHMTTTWAPRPPLGRPAHCRSFCRPSSVAVRGLVRHPLSMPEHTQGRAVL
jgi:hypothetical protein